MSTSTHKIAIKGADHTAAAFQSIQARAAAAGQRISRVMGGAIAAAGAYLSLRSIKGGIDELGKLSDIAQRTGTSVQDLTKTVTALQILGVNTSADALAKSFALMEKNTGRSGLSGFYETIDELRRIPDLSERTEAAFKIFGRGGAELLPLVNSSRDAVKAIGEVSRGLAGIPDKAAQAGDRAADALNIVGTEVKSVWLRLIGKIVDFFDARFPGGVREAAFRGAAYIEYFAKVSARYASAFAENWRDAFKNLGDGIAWALESIVRYMGEMAKVGGRMFIDMFKGTAENLWSGKNIDMSVGAMFDRAGGNTANETLAMRMRGAAHMAGATFADVATDDLEKRLKERLEAAGEAAKAAENGLGRAEMEKRGKELGEAAAKASRRVSNSLILAGSNQAQKVSILGPSYQTEQKKQTELLKQIEKNTAKTAEDTGDLPVTDL